MQLSREEIGRLAVLAYNCISFGVRAGIAAAKQNPGADAAVLLKKTMEALDPYIALHWNSATMLAQVRGTLEVE